MCGCVNVCVRGGGVFFPRVNGKLSHFLLSSDFFCCFFFTQTSEAVTELLYKMQYYLCSLSRNNPTEVAPFFDVPQEVYVLSEIIIIKQISKISACLPPPLSQSLSPRTDAIAEEPCNALASALTE